MTGRAADIVVIGSGAAGLSAALAAAAAGAEVLVLEKSRWVGGTSAMSGAGIWIPANHLARNAGISDSSEEALEYLRATAPDGCEVELEARVLDLDTDETGAVTGVSVEQRGRRLEIEARRGVVIATGGFEWNDTLRERYFPGPLDRIGSPRTNSGDGQEMAARVGAALDRMDQANVYATLPTRYEGEIHGIPALFHCAPHAIVVDRTGERFASEYDYNFGEVLDRREAATQAPVHLPCWMIADARFWSQSGMFRWYARKQPGWVRRAESIEALAEKVDLPPSSLRASVDRFNRFAHAGRDADFARGESIWERFKSGAGEGDPAPALGAIERPPFIAVPVNRSILVTKGGPRTNADGQVLRGDGSAIAGLYCAGAAMANPIGTRAVGAGTTLGPCLTWGYICAQSLMRTNR